MRGLHARMRVLLIAAAAAVCPPYALAADVNLVGMLPGRPILVIDGAPPHAMAVGTESNGVRLISATSDTAVVEVNGKRETLRLGQYTGGSASAGRISVTITADSGGHFLTRALVNDSGSVTCLVDTGASFVALPARDADRLGINYRRGTPMVAQTANGPVQFWRVQLDSIRIGDLVLNNVTAGVQESGLEFALLGMSFLNRTEMTRSGDTMVLTKRF